MCDFPEGSHETRDGRMSACGMTGSKGATVDVRRYLYQQHIGAVRCRFGGAAQPGTAGVDNDHVEPVNLGVLRIAPLRLMTPASPAGATS